jgi:hypothetical protein
MLLFVGNSNELFESPRSLLINGTELDDHLFIDLSSILLDISAHIMFDGGHHHSSIGDALTIQCNPRNMDSVRYIPGACRDVHDSCSGVILIGHYITIQYSNIEPVCFSIHPLCFFYFDS